MSSPNVNVLILLGSCMAMLSPVVVGISCITPSDPNQVNNVSVRRYCPFKSYMYLEREINSRSKV